MPDDAPRSAEAVVSARDLTIAYPVDGMNVIALRDFSLAIQPSEIVGLIGEAACGKTTAAIAMLGLLRPPGRVLSGLSLFTLSREALRALRGRDVGLIVQSPRGALNPLLPIGRQIATVYRPHNKVTRRAAREHALAILRQVGINDPERRYHAFPHEISGGMAQRVLIAIALTCRAAVRWRCLVARPKSKTYANSKRGVWCAAGARARPICFQRSPACFQR